MVCLALGVNHGSSNSTSFVAISLQVPKEMAVSALQFVSAVPGFVLRSVSQTIGLGQGISAGGGPLMSSDGIHSFLLLGGELGLVVGHGSHRDGFHWLVLLLDPLEVQGSFVGSMKVGIPVLHELPVLKADNEELGL